MSLLFGSDLSALARYVGIKNLDATALADLAEDAAATEAAIEFRCGPLSAFESVPDGLVIAGKMRARQLWRARTTNARTEDAGPGIGVAWPAQADDLIRPYELPPLGFA